MSGIPYTGTYRNCSLVFGYCGPELFSVAGKRKPSATVQLHQLIMSCYMIYIYVEDLKHRARVLSALVPCVGIEKQTELKNCLNWMQPVRLRNSASGVWTNSALHLNTLHITGHMRVCARRAELGARVRANCLSLVISLCCCCCHS